MKYCLAVAAVLSLAMAATAATAQDFSEADRLFIVSEARIGSYDCNPSSFEPLLRNLDLLERLCGKMNSSDQLLWEDAGKRDCLVRINASTTLLSVFKGMCQEPTLIDRAERLYNQSLGFYGKGDFSRAREYANTSCIIFKQLRISKGVAKCERLLGDISVGMTAGGASPAEKDGSTPASGTWTAAYLVLTAAVGLSAAYLFLRKKKTRPALSN